MTNPFGNLLALNPSLVAYEAVRVLGEGGNAVVETDSSHFHVEPFAKAGHVTLRVREDIQQGKRAAWEEKCGLFYLDDNVWLEAEWRGHKLDLVRFTWWNPSAQSTRWLIAAKTRKIAEDFFCEVAAFNSVIRDEVLVFEGGCWSKNEELFKAIQGATLPTLVLPPAMKEAIVEDLTSFFGAREIYEQHGVPWKRGILFCGPPGNGKTLAIKALINHLKKPCLYVKSFEAAWASEHACIRNVFARARDTAPCVLVFEDLDALINDGNKSYFLNELDGFAQNIGIVTLATTNHPERLDPAIRDRPSRFDRTYSFDLPELPQRLEYMKHWNETMKPALRLDDAALETVATMTESFSYAYIKELFFSSMMRWIGSGRGGAMKEIMAEQATLLRAQMAAAASLEAPPNAAAPRKSRLEAWSEMMKKLNV